MDLFINTACILILTPGHPIMTIEINVLVVIFDYSASPDPPRLDLVPQFRGGKTNTAAV